MLTIRPYQAEGIDFLVDSRRACLFDEPGLGKTMQSLLSMRELEPGGSTLVVATGDAVGVWRDEVRLWLEEEPAVFAGPKATPDDIGYAGQITITNYHRLRAALGAQRWDGVIFDESQMLRNRNTTTLFKAVRSYFDNRRYGLGGVPVFFLSGTPIVKHTGDIWPILHLIDKRQWSSYWKFVKRHAIVWHDEYGWHVEGVVQPQRLWAEVSSVVLRRLVEEVQPHLPTKHRKRIPLTMTPKQAKAYREIDKGMMAELASGHLLLTPTVLAKETRLRQILVTPRLVGIDDDGAALIALREIASSHSRPLVIFTPFAQALPFVESSFARVGRKVFTFRGGMDVNRVAKEFRAASKAGVPSVLAGTVQMGKSWSVSDVTHECYMLGIDWNNTTMAQAEARLHRDGQVDTVWSYYFVHEDTHDFDSLLILSGKKRLADAILDRYR